MTKKVYNGLIINCLEISIHTKMKPVLTTKFIELLSKLDQEEFASFEKWLSSPWCNSNKNLVSLISYLKKHYPDFTKLKMNKEGLFRKVMPGKKDSVGNVNNLFTDANRAIQRFLTFAAFNRDKSSQNIYLTQELQARHLEERFYKRSASCIDELEKKEVKDWEDFIDLLKLNRRIYHHSNQNRRMNSEDKTFEKMDKNLELAYLLEKAAIINEKIFRTRILKGVNHEELLKEKKKWQRASLRFDHPSIELYRLRFNYSKKNMASEFRDLNKKYLKIYKSLNQKEQKIHFFSLLNDSTFLRARGKIALSEVLPFYKIGLSEKLLFEKNRLNRIVFVSIISISNACKDFDFTQKVIDDYSVFLEEEARNDGGLYASAHLANRRGNLSECAEKLKDHHFDTHYFQLAGKILRLQNYFELFLKDDFCQEDLDNFCNSFEKWLQREKIRSVSNKLPFLNFVRMSRRLMNLYLDVEFDFKKADRMLKDMGQVQPREWLFTKRDEIVRIRKQRGRFR